MGKVDGERRPMDYALRVLSRRRVSTGRMNELLARKGFSVEESGECVAKLTEWGYLNDREYGKDVLHALSATCPVGKRRAVYELRKRSLDPELAQSLVMESSVDTSEEDMAKEAVKRYMNGKCEGQLKDKERDRLVRWMQRRGFGYESIRSALVSLDRGDPE